MEGALQLTGTSDRYFPYHQNTVKIHYPSNEFTPGVNGVSYFTTNSFGTRGPEPNGEGIRIITVGGSTTADTILDDSETWPALLMRYLNEDAKDDKFVWVTNSGVDGHNTHHHIMHAKYLIPLIPKLDYLVLYAGINEVGMWLYHEKFDPNYLDNPDNWYNRVGQAFRVSDYTAADLPWYKHFRIWKRASVAKDFLLSYRSAKLRERGVIVEDAQLRWIKEEQRKRQERAKKFVHRAKMETLPVALDAYENNLLRIIRLSREAGVEPIFMAQAMKAQFLDEEERRRLWVGAMDGGKSYVKQEQFLEILGRFNKRMQEVAIKEKVAFINLPSQLQKHKDLFYDGVHFNERGARLTARIVADYLQELVLK